MDLDIVELFYHADEFCKTYSANNFTEITKFDFKKIRRSRMSKSEIITILVYFHASGYRTFKAYYTKHVAVYWKHYFPDLLSYNRFLERIQSVEWELNHFLRSTLGKCTDISFIDSTPIQVCKPKRIPSNKVFAGIAEIGKSTIGWFYGFKLHLVINHIGEIIDLMVTPGNTDDRSPVRQISKKIKGNLFGDKGYISAALFKDLYGKGIKLVTSIKKNMKNKLMLINEKILLKKRSIIETVNDQLKNISQIEHSRHRSPKNFAANLFAGVIAYNLKSKKPNIILNEDEMHLLSL